MMSIHNAMIAIMADIGSIAKDKKNHQQHFNFRGIDDVYNRLHTIMARHGVFTTSEILDERRSERQSKTGGALIFVSIKIRYYFWAGDGTSVSTEVIGEGMDSGDKSTNKAMSIAHKYALLQAFLIPTEDAVDPDAYSPEPAYATEPPPTAETLLAQINNTNDLDALRRVWQQAKRHNLLAGDLAAQLNAKVESLKGGGNGTAAANT